jgi:hypothetical protein
MEKQVLYASAEYKVEKWVGAGKIVGDLRFMHVFFLTDGSINGCMMTPDSAVDIEDTAEFGFEGTAIVVIIGAPNVGHTIHNQRDSTGTLD